MRSMLVLASIVCINAFLSAQVSTVPFSRAFSAPQQQFEVVDTVIKPPVHSPKKAATMSALLPGLGQIYNKKYWKVPVIYAALGGLGYGFGWNQKYYKYYKNALHYRYDNDANTVDPLPIYPDEALVTYKNYYQRYRDACVIGMAAVYTLQVLDAAVDAHMFTFDVGPDLSLQWTPQARPEVYGTSFGVGLYLGYRN